MDTSCQNCEFNKKDISGNQVDCEMGRISLYLKQETKLESTGNPSYYTIKNRICSFCRAIDSEWGKDLSLEDKKIKAREEVKVKIHAVIVCGHNSKIEDILATGLSLEKQNPSITAHFVLTSNKPQSSTVISSLRRTFPQSSNLFWNIKLCYERRNGKPLEKGEASDTIINNLSPKDCQFYVILDPGAILWDSFSADIDHLINDKLEKFVYLKPIKQQDNNTEIGPIVHTKAHLAVGGNALAEREIDGKVIRCDSVEDKIYLLAKDQNLTYLIKDLYDLCPQI